MNAFLCVRNWCVACVVVCACTSYIDSLRVAVYLKVVLAFVRSVCPYVCFLPCCIEYEISFFFCLFTRHYTLFQATEEAEQP